MSFAKIYTRALLGLHAPSVEVEVHLSQGLPLFKTYLNLLTWV
mgnify:CR=1 FL=1